MSDRISTIVTELEALVRVASENKQKYQTVACNEVGSRIRKRIHNRGLNSKGRKIGDYTSEAYKRRRVKGVKVRGSVFKGLRVDRVDLQVSGDLLKGLQTGRSGNNIVLGIAGKEQVDKALWLEERYGDVWAPTSSEERAGEIKFVQAMDKDVKRVLR